MNEKKFYYGDQTVLILLSDSIARISNCFYRKLNELNEKTIVISLFLDADNDSNQKYIKKKIILLKKEKQKNTIKNFAILSVTILVKRILPFLKITR